MPIALDSMFVNCIMRLPNLCEPVYTSPILTMVERHCAVIFDLLSYDQDYCRNVSVFSRLARRHDFGSI